MEKPQTAEKEAKATEKGLGVAELYAISIGTVIGAGVFTVLGSAIAVTGKSVWIAYVLAVILVRVSVEFPKLYSVAHGSSPGRVIFHGFGLARAKMGRHVSFDVCAGFFQLCTLWLGFGAVCSGTVPNGIG